MSCEEYRSRIIEELERIKDEKILRRIYISTSVLVSLREGDRAVRKD